jgi:indole-3-glycerol phosphate synthase
MTAMHILDKIVTSKRKEVAAAEARVPLEHLIQRLERRPAVRPFLERLSKTQNGRVNIIAEIKRASPSKGLIRGDLDPATFARKCESGGAAALSVLTETEFFRGSVADLERARSAVRLPVLRKDFIVSAYQIYESAAIGADAILLITRILSLQELREYLDLSRDLCLDALVEVHSEQELDAATAAGARLVGINNRDLDTFRTDIATSERLAARLWAHQTGVAESGVHSREDLEKIVAAGISNFLIGESIIRAQDTQGFVSRLVGQEG